MFSAVGYAEESVNPFKLTVAANKDSYLLAEPVALEIVFAHAVPGPPIDCRGPLLDSRHGSLDIYVSFREQPEVKFWKGVNSDGGSATRTFQYGDKVTHVEILTLNYTTRAPVLASAGEYRIRAEYPSLGLKSNDLIIHTSTPEPSLIPYAEQFQNMAITKDLDFESPYARDSVVNPCIEFIGDGPSNIYQYYVSAWLGFHYARKENVEDAKRALRYLEPVLAADLKGFFPLKGALLFAGSSYAGTGKADEALNVLHRLKAEFPDSREAKKISDKELLQLEQMAAEARAKN